jgi:hypothetical protein
MFVYRKNVSRSVVRGRCRTLAISLLLAVSPVSLAGEETITVTATGDSADFAGLQQVGDLPGTDGEVTIREAILAANNTAGPQTIAFNIPQSDPGFSNGVFQSIISAPPMALTDDETTIDGFTQEQFTGDTNPSGGEISFFADIGGGGLSIPGLRIDSDNNVVRGVVGFNFFQYGIEINGNGNLIEGVLVVQAGSAAIHIQGDNNIIDGSAGGQLLNRFSSGGVGVWVRSDGSGNTIIGNLIEVNNNDGVNLEGNANIVGGADAASRNRIRSNGHASGEGHPVGAQVDISGNDNIVQGNWLGVDDTGNADNSGLARYGVFINGSNNLIGGANQAAGNVMAGHGFANFSTRHGVQIVGGVGNTIQNNFIGVGADGITPIPNEQGISVDVFLFANVPMDTLIEGNIIANSDEDGVRVAGFDTSVPTGITISANRIFNNQGGNLSAFLGIDLNSDGVTPNDPGDGDNGPNRLQNFPVLTSAASDGSTITIEGTLNSVPSESFTIEFFANAACDPSGHGEAEFFLGSVQAMTDAQGNASFSAMLEWDQQGSVISATATRLSTGDTSELSACISVQKGGVPGDLTGDGVVGPADLAELLAQWGACGDCGDCPADLDGSCSVGPGDLGELLANWG